MESSKALQEHFPTLLHNALEPWAATIQQNNYDALALHKQYADDTTRYMEQQQAYDMRNVQLQNRAAIDAVQNLQAMLKAIGASIEKTVMSEPVHKPTYHNEFVQAVSSYHGELRHLNTTVGRIPVSKLNRTLSYHKESDNEEYLKSGELGRQLKLWYEYARFCSLECI
jgi:bifunctional pyridoxal-dependent enzyme with beta-cystathionase and maltose regulon repressor activities